jgi:hypothetical protein
MPRAERRRASITEQKRRTAIAVLALGMVFGGTAHAAAVDTTPPAVTALAVVPTSVDTSTAPAVVTVRATIADDASGVPTGRSVVRLRSPSGKQTTAGSFVSLGGDQFAAQVKIAAHAETGIWRLYSLYLVDGAGNMRYVYPADLASLGVDLALSVTGIPDTTPPALAAISVAPASVDAGTAPAVATVTATITDDLAGVNDTTDPCSISCYGTSQIAFMSPSRTQFAVGQFTSIGGDQYAEQVSFPAHAEPGVWHVNNLHLIDTAGNERFLSASDLAAVGLNISIEVVATDAPPPTIEHTVSPETPDGQSGWYVSAPTVGFSCADATYGIASCLADGHAGPSVTLGESGGPQTVTATAISDAGSLAYDSVAGLRVDLSDPTVICRSAAFLVGQAGATVSANVADSVSGPRASSVGASVSTATGGSFSVDLTGVDLAGRSVTVACPYTVLATPSVATLTTFQRQTSFAVSWSAPNGSDTVASYDVRYQSASTAGGFGAWTTWQSTTTDTTAGFAGTPGSTYCFAARARDAGGNVTRWSAYRCTAVPIDDTATFAAGTWTRSTGSAYYLGTFSVSPALGDTLTLANVSAKHVSLLVTKCPTCGTIQLLWNGTVLQTISLRSSTTRTAQLLTAINLGSLQTGAVSAQVASSGRPVEIDGLGVSQK